MAEQRDWSSGMKKDDAGRYVHGACRIDGDGFCVTHQSANWAECANAKMPPPSAAPSQPQQQRECTHHRMMPHCYECEQEAAAGIDGMPNMPDNPSQPQQQDLVAVSVLDPEPGQPSNPAVARKGRRRLLINSADYWFEGSRDATYTLAERLLFMENALNHTENALIEALEEPAGEWAIKLRAELAKRREPLTGPTNEGHGR